MFNEQPENAARAEAFGIAPVVATDAPVDAIRTTIATALADRVVLHSRRPDEMRQRSVRGAASVGSGAGENAVGVLEQLLVT